LWGTYLAFLCQGSCGPDAGLVLRLGSKWRHMLVPIADSWEAAGMGGMGVPAAVRAWFAGLPFKEKRQKEG
jgi:hypothetical protein